MIQNAPAQLEAISAYVRGLEEREKIFSSSHFGLIEECRVLVQEREILRKALEEAVLVLGFNSNPNISDALNRVRKPI